VSVVASDGSGRSAGLDGDISEFEQAGPPVIVVNEAGQSPFVLLCEHASRLLPMGYGRLGLAPAEFDRHIAWDLGAAEVATRLAGLLDAPLFLAGYSRLLIDLNRPPDSTTSIPEVSEATAIPGNVGIGAAERRRRRALWFDPFHEAVASHLDARHGRATAVVGVHSFTPVFEGVSRPWHAGVLFREAEAFGEELTAAIAARSGALVGRNEPYRVSLDHDYTVPIHGDARGLPSVLIEVRQDLVSDVLGIERWSYKLSTALADTLHVVLNSQVAATHPGSR
jgi:predicted N-formylglutamate amidohydrolase